MHRKKAMHQKKVLTVLKKIVPSNVQFENNLIHIYIHISGEMNTCNVRLNIYVGPIWYLKQLL